MRPRVRLPEGSASSALASHLRQAFADRLDGGREGALQHAEQLALGLELGLQAAGLLRVLRLLILVAALRREVSDLVAEVDHLLQVRAGRVTHGAGHRNQPVGSAALALAATL